MKELHDPRTSCELCLMNYGMESVRHESLCASKNCLAVIAASHKNRPTFILIFPKKHEIEMDKIKRDSEMYKEIRRLVRRTETELKEKYRAKKFKSAWCNGGMLLHLGALRPKGVNSHAHIKMDVCYR